MDRWREGKEGIKGKWELGEVADEFCEGKKDTV